MKRTKSYLVLAVSMAAMVQAAPARAQAGCDDAGLLSSIEGRFAGRAVSYLHSDINIAKLDRVQYRRLELRDETHSVERQYCSARATMTDGRKRTVWYLIERNWGFAGLGQSVEFCLSGLDPWHVYGRACRSLR